MVPPDELEPDPPDELEPDPPDELEAAVVMDAPEELGADEFDPVVAGDPPEPEDAEAPEPGPLDPPPPGPRAVSPPLLELEPFVGVLLDPEELAPPEPELSVVGLSVASEELPHPVPEPASPQRITRVVRRCIALHVGRRRCPPEGLTGAQLHAHANCPPSLKAQRLHSFGPTAGRAPFSERPLQGEQPPSLHFEPVSAEMGHTLAQLKSRATS